METPKRVDVLDLANTARSRLSFPKGNLRPLLSKEDAGAIWNGRLFSSEEKEPYFSVVFLLSKEEEKIYPLFFFEAYRNSEGLLSRTGDLPLFSEVALSFLKGLGADVKDTSRINDPDSYLTFLQGALDAKAKGKAEILYGLRFYSEEDVSYSGVYLLSQNLYSHEETPIQYQGLLQNVSVQKEKERNRNAFLLENAIDKENIYKVLKVSFHEKDLKEEFLVKKITYSLLHKRTISFVFPDEEKKTRFVSFLKENGLENFFFDFSKFQPEASLPFLVPEAKKSARLSFAKKNISLRKNERSYLLLSQRKREILKDVPKDSSNLEQISSFLAKDSDPLPLPLEDYSEEEFQADESFLSRLSSWPSVLSVPLSLHPFFGLSVSGKKENYTKAEEVVKEIDRNLSLFEETLSRLGLTRIGGEPILDFLDFETLLDDTLLLSDYNGFPKKFFNIRNQPDRKALSDLKVSYQAVSSSRLLVLNLCDSSIFLENIPLLLSTFKTGKFKARREAKKRICSYMKGKTKLEPLVRILSSYVEAYDKLKRDLPGYEEIYGDSVDTMNGVVEIESNMKYLERFFSRKGKNPDFTLDNPVVKKALKEKNYREDLLSRVQEANQIYLQLKQLFNRYFGFFLDAPENFVAKPFHELHALLSVKKDGTYQEFIEMALFLEAKENTSTILQMVIRSDWLKNKPLTGIQDSFLHAVYSNRYRTYRKEIDAFRNDKKDNEVRYFYGLYDLDGIRKEERAEAISKETYRRYEEAEGEKAYQEIEKNLGIPFLKPETRKKEIALLSITHPIFLLTSKDLLQAPDLSLDDTVSFGSVSYSTPELLHLLRASKNVIFLEEIGSGDTRIQGYQGVFLSTENIEQEMFSPYILPPSMEKHLRTYLNSKGLLLEEEKNGFSFSVKEKEGGQEKGILVPSLSVVPGYEELVASLVREYLFQKKGRKLLLLDVKEASFDQENAFKGLLDSQEEAERIYKEEIQEKKERELSEKVSPSLENLIGSFAMVPASDQIDQILKVEPEDAFKILEPIPVSKFSLLKSHKLRAFVRKGLREKKLVVKDGFLRYQDEKEISFRRSLPGTRTSQDISEAELRAGILSVLSVSPLPEKKLYALFLRLCGTTAEDASFLSLFRNTLLSLSRDGKTKEEEDGSLYLA
ncbi:MAG: hypothetical protein WCS91_02820 [Bacilli bacterium]